MATPWAISNRRAADISVDHPAVVENYRAAQAIAARDERGEADTEELRKAVVHYRVLFDEMLEVGEAKPEAFSQASGGASMNTITSRELEKGGPERRAWQPAERPPAQQEVREDLKETDARESQQDRARKGSGSLHCFCPTWPKSFARAGMPFREALSMTREMRSGRADELVCAGHEELGRNLSQ